MKDPYSTRDARLMTADDLRKLVRSINNQNEGINSSLDAQGMLDLEWACWDGGTWDGYAGWRSCEPEAADGAFDYVLEGVMYRGKSLTDDALSVPFCACGRRLTECDGSRIRCTRV